MTETLKYLSSEADEKQEKRFKLWLSGDKIPFVDAKAKALYMEKATLIKDAVQMKQTPQRVPICPSAGHFPLEYAGLSFYDAMYDEKMLSRALDKYYNDFDPDTFTRSMIGSGRILDLLDAKQYHWPGHGVSRDHEYQFVEDERMRPEEYDLLINDPSDFHLRYFLPRVCGALTSFAKLPPLLDLRHMSSMAPGTYPFSLPEVQETFSILAAAGKEADRWLAAVRETADAIMGRGYPTTAGGTAEAPYDIIADNYRGTRGISLDIIRRPEKVLQACEVLVQPQIKRAVDAADATLNPFIFMPLHKGAHSFMSQAQFRRFYWPSLRKLLIGMINNGLVPVLFAESNYNSRLEIISDLPEGKAIWWFENVDMARAKATVGRRACLAGNLPNILFRSGTPDDVKQYCKKLIDVAGKDGGYILSTAAGLQGAKPENVRTMIEYGRAYGKYA